MMYKVQIEFKNGIKKEFYAYRSFQSDGEGRLMTWENPEQNKYITYPVDLILEVIELEIDDKT